MVKYLYHGYMVEAKKLTYQDKEGVDWDADTGSVDGAFYIRTTVGKENFVPGDYLVSTLDGASVRVRTKEQFEPFAKEVEGVPEKTGGIDGGGVGIDVHGQSGPGRGDAVVRMDHGKVEVVGKTDDARRRSAAQRRDGNTRRDESKSLAEPQRSRKAHALNRIRAARRRNNRE